MTIISTVAFRTKNLEACSSVAVQRVTAVQYLAKSVLECHEAGFCRSSMLELEDGDGTSLTSSCGMAMVFEALVRFMLLFHSKNSWKRAEFSTIFFFIKCFGLTVFKIRSCKGCFLREYEPQTQEALSLPENELHNPG